MAGRVLSTLESDEGDEVQRPQLSYEDRLAELELHVVWEMQKVMGWQVDPPSGAMDWLVQEATDVLSAEDPFRAFDEWESHPPDLPATVG